MANRFWPGADPLGQRFKDTAGTSHEIIGVVADISSRQVGKLDGPLFYTPASPAKLSGLSFILRTNDDQPATIGAIREVARSLDKDAFVSAEPLAENVRRTLEPARTGAWFSGTISLLALLIAATGIYGMLSYLVVDRTSEIGIRMALGAHGRSVLWLVLREALLLVAVGLVIGVLTSLAVTKTAATLLYELKPNDPLTIALAMSARQARSLASTSRPSRTAVSRPSWLVRSVR